jgi:hypothetical protein
MIIDQKSQRQSSSIYDFSQFSFKIHRFPTKLKWGLLCMCMTCWIMIQKQQFYILIGFESSPDFVVSLSASLFLTVSELANVGPSICTLNFGSYIYAFSHYHCCAICCSLQSCSLDFSAATPFKVSLYVVHSVIYILSENCRF